MVHKDQWIGGLVCSVASFRAGSFALLGLGGMDRASVVRDVLHPAGGRGDRNPVLPAPEVTEVARYA